jgi:hypothetical protein
MGDTRAIIVQCWRWLTGFECLSDLRLQPFGQRAQLNDSLLPAFDYPSRLGKRIGELSNSPVECIAQRLLDEPLVQGESDVMQTFYRG